MDGQYQKNEFMGWRCSGGKKELQFNLDEGLVGVETILNEHKQSSVGF